MDKVSERTIGETLGAALGKHIAVYAVQTIGTDLHRLTGKKSWI